jgi:hypothetical protein
MTMPTAAITIDRREQPVDQRQQLIDPRRLIVDVFTSALQLAGTVLIDQRLDRRELGLR